MKWKYVLTNHNETSERHPDEQLKSRYYKTTQAAALKEVKQLFEQMDGYHIVAISEERGEMSVSLTKGKKHLSSSQSFLFDRSKQLLIFL